MEIKSYYRNGKKIYSINGEQVEKNVLLKTIRDLVKKNNELYYNSLRSKDFDYTRQYREYDGYIMDYKEVKKDILNNGMIYTFTISLGIL